MPANRAIEAQKYNRHSTGGLASEPHLVRTLAPPRRGWIPSVRLSDTGLPAPSGTQPSKVSSRDPSIANLNSLGILLVVLGHSAPTKLATVSGPAQSVFREILGLITHFHMPLFFFLSGYLFIHTLPKPGQPSFDFLSFALGKARRLLLPYWVLSTVAFPLKALMATEAARPLGFSLKDYLTSLFVPWQNTIIFYWFLPTLFLIFLVAPLLALALRPRSFVLPLAITAALAALNILIIPIFWQDFLNYRGAASHLITFWLGMLWRSRIPSLSVPTHAMLATSGALLFTAISLANYARILPEAPLFQAVVRITLALSGVLTCVGLVHALTLGGMLTRFPLIDGHSYQIYLLSWFPQMLVKILVFRWLHAGFWPAAFLMFTLGLLLPVWVSQSVARRFPRLKPCLGLGK